MCLVGSYYTDISRCTVNKTFKMYIVFVPFIVFSITYNLACVRVKCIVTVSVLLLMPNVGKVTDDMFYHITSQGYSVHCRAYVCR